MRGMTSPMLSRGTVTKVNTINTTNRKKQNQGNKMSTATKENPSHVSDVASKVITLRNADAQKQ